MNALLSADSIARCAALLADDSGQGLVEYALIIALLSVTAIGVLSSLGRKVEDTLSKAQASLS